MLNNCAYCKKEITQGDFIVGNSAWLEIKNGEKIENIDVHEECFNRYIESKKIYNCERCIYYGYLSNKEEYFIDSDGKPYHNECLHNIHSCDSF